MMSVGDKYWDIDHDNDSGSYYWIESLNVLHINDIINRDYRCNM